jgi:hypothetical protein
MKLTKWYYDLVSDTGQVLIGYGVILKLFGLMIPWRACFFWDNENSIFEQGIGRFQSIENDELLLFTVPHTRLQGQWQKSTQTRVSHLLHNDRIHVAWQGLSINACAEIELNGQKIKGMGYVERLDLSFKTAHLPFRKLSWGRFIEETGQQLLVWIQFDGAHATTQIFDGVQYYDEATICQQSVIYPGGVLEMSLEQDLLETRIASHVPRLLEKMFGGSIVSGHESKWLSRGLLKNNATGQLYKGWVIHEEVKW